MIYLDNAATTLQKPPCVGQAMLDALEHAGNPGRGAHEPTLHAARIVYYARETLATLLHAEGPDCIAFTANVTQALNTALCGLVRPGDHVITTVCEHNSVLRPLYRRGGGNEDFFAVSPGDYDGGLVQADMTMSQVRYRRALSQAEEVQEITPDALTAGYPGLGQSVAQVIHNTDERCKTLQ